MEPSVWIGRGSRRLILAEDMPQVKAGSGQVAPPAVDELQLRPWHVTDTVLAEFGDLLSRGDDPPYPGGPGVAPG